MDMRFVCSSCHLERNVRTELSTYTKTEITHGKRSQDANLVCKYCAPAGTLPAIIEPPKDKVHVREVEGGPVTEDRIMSYKEAAAAAGIPDGAFRKLVSKGIITKYTYGSGKRDVGIRASELHRYMMTDAYQYRLAHGGATQPPEDDPKRAALREQKRQEALARPSPDPVKPKRKLAKDLFIKRNALGMSQREVGELVGATQSDVSHFERGLSIHRNKYEKICRHFLEMEPPKPTAPPNGRKRFPNQAGSTPAKYLPKPQSNGVVDDAGAVKYRTVTKKVEVPVIPISMPEEAVRPDPMNPDSLLEQAQSMLQAGDIDLATKLMDLAMTLLSRQRERRT